MKAFDQFILCNFTKNFGHNFTETHPITSAISPLPKGMSKTFHNFFLNLGWALMADVHCSDKILQRIYALSSVGETVWVWVSHLP